MLASLRRIEFRDFLVSPDSGTAAFEALCPINGPDAEHFNAFQITDEIARVRLSLIWFAIERQARLPFQRMLNGEETRIFAEARQTEDERNN